MSDPTEIGVVMQCIAGHGDIRFTTSDYDATFQQQVKLIDGEFWNMQEVQLLVQIPRFGSIFKMSAIFSYQEGDTNGCGVKFKYDNVTTPDYLTCSIGRESASTPPTYNITMTPTHRLIRLIDFANSADILPFVYTMSATQLIPVYTTVNNVRTCSFGQYDGVVWTVLDGDRGRGAVAVKGFCNFLSVNVQTPPSNNIKGNFSIRMVFKAQGGPTASPWHGQRFTQQLTPGPTYVFAPWLVQPYNYLPSGFRGHIHWTTFFDDDPEFPLRTGVCPIEFYALHENVPQYIDKGIPAQLLRILLLKKLDGIEDSYLGWIKYCIEFLRAQGFSYENINGVYNYCDFPQGRVTRCYLEHWLSHYTALHENLDSVHTRRVNCYDLASLGQVFIALGLDASRHSLRMKWLGPFGMINPTDLIGFPDTKCNSPFFGDADNKLWSTHPYWDPTTAKGKYRSGFKNHVFLTVRDVQAANVELVIDATCGPEIGEKTVAQYVATAIDHDASNNLRFVETSEGHEPNQLISPAGKAEDVLDGDGVVSLLSPIDMRHFSKNTSKGGLLHKVDEIQHATGFPKNSGFTGPSIHVDGITVTLTWHFQATSSLQPATIDLIVYAVRAEDRLKSEYQIRAGLFANSMDDAPPGIESFLDASTKHTTLVQGIVQPAAATSGTYAVWEQYHNYYGLIAIVAGLDKDVLKFMVNSLVNAIEEDLLDSAQLGDLKVFPTETTGEAISASDVYEMTLGEITVLNAGCSLKNGQEEVIPIIGVDVATDDGKLVYTNTIYDPKTNVYSFEFYPRVRGATGITITFFTSHVQATAWQQKINVI